MNTSVPLDFIHIGMGKCASTYLLHVFNYDHNCDCLDVTGLVSEARKMARTNNFTRQRIRLSSVPVPGRPQMASAEGFTFAFLNEPQRYSKMALLHKFSARLLGESKLTNQILVIVRDPVDWLRSAHEQYVKQGGHLSYTAYFESAQQLLRQSLDLANILKEFGKYFDVVVLSSDELKKSPDIFWGRYSENLKVREPSKQVFQAISGRKVAGNQSLGSKLPLLAKLNKIHCVKSEILEHSSNYRRTFQQEYPRLSKSIKDSWIWGNRRLVEFGSENELLALEEDLNIEKDFQKVFVDTDMKEHLEAKFLKPLTELPTIPESLVMNYLEKVEQVLVE